MSIDEERLRTRFCDADQGHVFRFWDDLASEDRQALLAQLDSIELDRLQLLIERHLAQPVDEGPLNLEPPEVCRLPESQEEEEEWARWKARGEECLRAGELAVLMVAGGQASRLGFDGPKGTYPITPVTGKSLFQLHIEKLLALRRRCGQPVPMIVLVAPHNRAATKKFFERHRHFGLEPEDLWLVEQGVLPAVDRDGRLLLAEKGRLFLSPDGHGGIYRALQRAGIYERLRERGIRSLFYFQVDNPLVRVGDPTFLGLHRSRDAQFSLKVCRKRDGSEKVGVFARINGVPGVIEYSDLPAEARGRDVDGELCFWAGSIGIHLLEVDFMEEMVAGDGHLPYHMARKRVPSLDDEGEPEKSAEANGLKFESFVFDALRHATRCAALEVLREEEFAPVKNQEGEDSPATALEAQIRLFHAWLVAAGIRMSPGDADRRLEIGPLFALDQEEFVERIRQQDLDGARRLLFD